jgi:DNA-binding CsgD family transcriptional regulator
MTTGSEHSGPLGDRPFVGRVTELAAMRDALDLACAGQGRVVMLAGPPGIGKTRTAQQVAEHAVARDMLVLWGRCPEEAGAPPYWPWLQAVRHYVAMHDDATVQITLGAAASHFAAMDPQLVPPLTPLAPLAPPADAAQARFQLFDAIAGFWQRAAARQPLLLVLDDLHCADTPSLRLLEFVASTLSTSRMLLLGTFRDAEVTRTHPLSDTLGMLARQAGTQRLKLGGFSQDETAQFLGAIGKEPSPGLAAAMHQRTDGHPLFLAEMARLLDETGGASDRGAPWLADLQRVPAGVREVIGSRLNRLSPLCSHALGNAAVIGRRFDFELLGSLLDERSEDELLAALDEARSASLIEALPEPGTYQFTHALIRDALYDEMPAPPRMRVHQRIASTLERLHGSDPAPWLSALAHHYGAAGTAGSTAKAVEYATRAAVHAEATLAYEEAGRLYTEALRAIEPAREAERCSLLLALGDVQTKTAAHEAAIETFNEAAKLARHIAAPGALARAALGYETCSWRTNGVGIVAAALVKEALAANPLLDSPQRARLLAALCRALVNADRVDAAVAIHGQAVQMARRLNDSEVLFAALSAIVPARWRPDLLPLRLAAGREAMQLAERAGNPEWAVGHLTGWHVGDLMESGDTEGAARTTRFGADASTIHHQPYVHLVLTNCRAMMALHAGRFNEAEQLAMQCMQYATRFGQAGGAAAVQLFTLRREQGRLAELAPVLEHFQRTVPDSGIWQPGYIVLCCELGRQEQALAAFERLAAKNFAIGGASDGARTGGLVYLSEACAWLGDAPRAATLYELLQPHAGSGIVFGAHVASLGSADRVLGMLAATMERWDVAEAHFERALAFNEASGGHPWLAHTRHEYATMLLERKQAGDAQRAGALLAAALATSRELGMPALEQRVLALQQQASHGGERASYPAGLSAREVQVLQMVAEGMTNQDIAKALFRSVNTVANHVRNILAKIDAANRTEAAAFAVRHGLLKP